MLADRARVLGGLPDVVTIQEGKVSTVIPASTWGKVPTPYTVVLPFAHPHLCLISLGHQNHQRQGQKFSVPVRASCQASLRTNVCLVSLDLGHFPRVMFLNCLEPLGCMKTNLKALALNPVTTEEKLSQHTGRYHAILWLRGNMLPREFLLAPSAMKSDLSV